MGLQGLSPAPKPSNASASQCLFKKINKKIKKKNRLMRPPPKITALVMCRGYVSAGSNKCHNGPITLRPLLSDCYLPGPVSRSTQNTPPAPFPFSPTKKKCDEVLLELHSLENCRKSNYTASTPNTLFENVGNQTLLICHPGVCSIAFLFIC